MDDLKRWGIAHIQKYVIRFRPRLLRGRICCTNLKTYHDLWLLSNLLKAFALHKTWLNTQCERLATVAVDVLRSRSYRWHQLLRSPTERHV